MKLNPDVNLFDHQIKALQFCRERQNALICFTTGSGKSLIMISNAISHIKSGRSSKFFIVVTASSIIELENDFKKFTNVKPVLVKEVDDLLEFMRSEDSIALVQYNWLSKWTDLTTDYTGKRKWCKVKPEVYYALKGSGVSFAMDEVHCLKNYKSTLSKSARAILKLAYCRYGFTATPLTRELLDLFYVVEVISPGYLGTFNSFLYKYVSFFMMGTIRKITGYKNLEELNKSLTGLMLTYFPEQKIEFIKHSCELTLVDKYHEAARGLFSDDGGNEDYVLTDDDEEEFEETKTFAARLIDLQYVVNDDPSKREKLIQVIKDNLSTGCIVYCSYHRTIASLKELLNEEGIEHMEITGTKTKKGRIEAKDWFNSSPENKVLILSKAGGQSLNLQSCPTFIYAEVPQNPATLLQSLGRIVRIGSKYKEFYIHFVIAEDTVDQYKYDYVSQNKEVFEKVMNNKAIPKSDALSGYNGFIIDRLKREYLWARGQ